jgi:glycosyltransferase involved in cell wall biosynthesis
VPSICEETFGLVALEGMACGCVPIVARSGGLPEAVGEAGVVFERGDPAGLAAVVEALFAAPERMQRLRAEASRQLARHAPERIAYEYLQIIAAAGARHATHGPARAV